MKRKYVILISLSLFLIVFDQVTKILIMESFRLGETLPVIQGFFDITHVHNTGAAFGFLAKADPMWRKPFFLIVPMIALGVIAYIFRKIPDTSIKLAVALSCVIGGAVGNLIDRVRLGYVVDFLLFHWDYKWQFPAFNVADTAICIGVGILMLDLFTAPEEEEKNASATV